MYIPSEGVFSEVLDDSTTLTYGREKKFILLAQIPFTITYK